MSREVRVLVFSSTDYLPRQGQRPAIEARLEDLLNQGFEIYRFYPTSTSAEDERVSDICVLVKDDARGLAVRP